MRGVAPSVDGSGYGVFQVNEIEREQVWMLRMLLGVERCTPSYIVLQETGRWRLTGVVRKWVVRYEEVEKGLGADRLVGAVWMWASRERWGKGPTDWQRGRKAVFEAAGLGVEEAERLVVEGEWVSEKVWLRLWEVEGQGRQHKIEGSSYNPGYALIQVCHGQPGYLQREWNREDRVCMARARCGSAERGWKEWIGEEYVKCVMCRAGKDTFAHLADECWPLARTWGRRARDGKRWLKEDESGLEDLKELGRVKLKQGAPGGMG